METSVNSDFYINHKIVHHTRRLLHDTAICRYKTNGAYRARTCDPLLVRQMLSQLS